MITASPDLWAQLPLSQACAVLEIGRGSYYRHKGTPCCSAAAADPEEGALRAAIEQAVLASFPGYGYPRVTRQLQRDGFTVNHKRVCRLMREAGLLQERKRRAVRTTNSEHGWPIYPNLLPERGWRQLTRPDDAWGADLTYVRLGAGFCYLAVLLIPHRFSRRLDQADLSMRPTMPGNSRGPGQSPGSSRLELRQSARHC